MKVIVDTCVWSMALRRDARRNKEVVHTLSELISDMRVQMLGPIRQELLSGLRSESQFDRIREALAAFDDLLIRSEDFETAARFFNLCRGVGVQGSNTDFLICAVAVRHQMFIFTQDRDFRNFAEHIPIRLYPA